MSLCISSYLVVSRLCARLRRRKRPSATHPKRQAIFVHFLEEDWILPPLSHPDAWCAPLLLILLWLLQLCVGVCRLFTHSVISSTPGRPSHFRARSMHKRRFVAFLASFAGLTEAFWRLPCRGSAGVARMDPLVDPGMPSYHVHSVQGSGGESSVSSLLSWLHLVQG